MEGVALTRRKAYRQIDIQFVSSFSTTVSVLKGTDQLRYSRFVQHDIIMQFLYFSFHQ